MTEKRNIFHSLFLPVLFLLVIWSVKLLETEFDFSLVKLGIYPRRISGFVGIVAAPFIHDNWKHLVNNSVPFLILSFATFYFYRPLGYKVVFLTWAISGFWVWCAARSAYHIGASGLVYGLASFLFFSGVFRKVTNLAAVSLIVIFLYGSMIWGIFPFVPEISWEGHLAGGLSGLILAIYYKNDGPQRQPYQWELDDDDQYPVSEDDKVLLELGKDNAPEKANNASETTENQQQREAKIVYLYKKSDHTPTSDDKKDI